MINVVRFHATLGYIVVSVTGSTEPHSYCSEHRTEDSVTDSDSLDGRKSRKIV